MRADVPVASDDDQLLVDGGLAASLERAGGPTIYEEARSGPRGELGSVVPTGAGHLSARQVFHAMAVGADGSGAR